jgi:hypothetical protein
MIWCLISPRCCGSCTGRGPSARRTGGGRGHARLGRLRRVSHGRRAPPARLRRGHRHGRLRDMLLRRDRLLGQLGHGRHRPRRLHHPPRRAPVGRREHPRVRRSAPRHGGIPGLPEARHRPAPPGHDDRRPASRRPGRGRLGQVGSKFLAATFARLSWQAGAGAAGGGEAEGRRAA